MWLGTYLHPSSDGIHFVNLVPQDCRAYFEATGRRVTFEYTLLKGINDAPAHAKQLASLLRRARLSSHVNLIPYNTVDDSEYQRPTKDAVRAFEAELIAGGCARRRDVLHDSETPQARSLFPFPLYSTTHSHVLPM